MSGSGPPYWGKYRGEVTSNADDQHRGRIKAKVRDLFGERETGWAEPSFPYAGPKVGFYFVPPERAMVWIEFERGDPERPIWSGCFLRAGTPAAPSIDLPTPVQVDAKKKIIRTDKWMLTLDDDTSKLVVESMQGNSGTQRIVIETNKITIANGRAPLATIELDGNKVSINGTALEVV